MKLQTVTCPSCNGTIEIDLNGREFVFCPYCGQQIHVDTGKTEVTINKNININKNVVQTKRYENVAEVIREREESKKSKGSWIVLIVLILIMFGLQYNLRHEHDVEEASAISQGKVTIGYSGDLEGQKYESVMAHFKAAGFDNIELIDLNDSGVLFWKEGDVVQISIEGKTSFGSGDYFSPDSTVVISYH